MSHNTSILLSFDIEEFDLPEEYGVKVPTAERLSVSQLGANRILDVLESTGVKATMFTTAFFAENSPEIIKRMLDGGHEIASHSMNHTSFEPGDLTASRVKLSELSGRTITGLRMPRLAKVSKEDIVNAGYEYESSMNPIFLPGRYNNLSQPLLPFKEDCGLWQLPISAVPFIRFPLFWLSFKTIPLPIYLLLAKFAVGRTHYFNMYSHPWEYNEASADKKWGIPAYITRHAGLEMAHRLKTLISSLKEKGDFITFQEYLINNQNH